MKALILEGPGRGRVGEAPRPVPRADEVVVRVRSTGICGTDVHAYCGEMPFFRYPGIPGHENAGEVVEVGSGVAHVGVGDRVVVDPAVACGECHVCRKGRWNCCPRVQCIGVHRPGSFAEYLLAPATNVYRLPDAIAMDMGACAEPLSIGLQAVTRGRVGAGDWVAIVGAGTIGLCVLQMARAKGARVAVSDSIPMRLHLARELGAELAVDIGRDDYGGALADWTDGRGPDVVIEAVGTAATVRHAFDLAAPSGRVVILGIVSGDVAIPGDLLVRKELDVFGSRMNARLFPEVLRLIESGAVDPRPLVTHTFGLDDAVSALELARARPDEAIKILLKP